MKNLMQTQPVLVLLEGIAGVFNLGLVAANALGAVTLDAGQVTAVVAAVQGAATLAAAVVRAAVVSPATHAEAVQAALMTPPPAA